MQVRYIPQYSMIYNAMGFVKLLFLPGTHITCNLIYLGKPQVEENVLNCKSIALSVNHIVTTPLSAGRQHNNANETMFTLLLLVSR